MQSGGESSRYCCVNTKQGVGPLQLEIYMCVAGRGKLYWYSTCYGQLCVIHFRWQQVMYAQAALQMTCSIHSVNTVYCMVHMS